MKIAQFEDVLRSYIGIEHKGQWIDYSRAHAAWCQIVHATTVPPVTSLDELLMSGSFDLERKKEVLSFVAASGLSRFLRVPPHARFQAPVRRPGKIVALGLNYALHAKEGNYAVPKEPIIFAKASSSIIGPGETIMIPRGMGQMDHEVELAVIVGKRAERITKRQAHKYIAGYTICNDVTARELQTSDIGKKHPWFRSKSFDTFTPLGPWMVTADEFRQPVHINVECRVNGKLRQKANTRHFVFDIPTVMEFISKNITLEPGDVISTGTPEGIGPIVGGDTVVCRVEGIGELKNPVKYR